MSHNLTEELILLSPDVRADLNNCDREPIHIPSSVQPHGMLIAARSSDLQVVYVSENSLEYLGVDPAFLFARTLPEVLGIDAVASIQEALGDEQYFPTSILTFSFPISGAARFDVLANRTGGLLCVEIEIALEERRWEFISTRMEKTIRELRRINTLQDLCTLVPSFIRTLTGYDRVMIYRFDPNGHGEIIGESSEPDMEPFLGLHYPATDIPRQARRLYLLQRIRTIVDMAYQPVRVLGHPVFAQSEPLDMTYCGLRSVSPIHVEYLQNMGVGASLGISLIQKGELWGMVICHHRNAKRPSQEVRALCDSLGQLVSLLIGTTVLTEDESGRIAKKSGLDALSAAIEHQDSIGAALAEHSEILLTLVAADGALIRIGDQVWSVGQTPPIAEANGLVEALHGQLVDGIAYSDNVGEMFPDFAHLADCASGAMKIHLTHEPISNQRASRILWVRGEVARTVNWGGDPATAKFAASEDGLRMSPRKSFALWKQVQRGRSLPWLPGELEAARGLQRIITSALLKRTEMDLVKLQVQQAAAAQLEATYAQLSSVMESTTDGVIRISRDWTILFANRRASEELAELKIGTSLWECLPILSETSGGRRLRTAMGERIETEYEFEHSANGQWYRCRVFPQEDGIGFFFSNFTAEKTMLGKLEVEQLVREKRIEALSHMAGGLAHEISNPLAIIHGKASDLQSLAESEPQIPSAEVRKACDSIVKTADRAIRILRGLRGFSREADKDPMEPASIYEIIDQSLELQQARIDSSNIDLQLDVKPGIPIVECRETQVGQVVTNLLNNAFDAIVQSSTLERWILVTAYCAEDKIFVEVSDSGPAIDEKLKPQLMEPFFTTKEFSSGTGIGLSLSRAIAQDHGGSLTLCDDTKNTCFRLVLPVTPPPELLAQPTTTV